MDAPSAARRAQRAGRTTAGKGAGIDYQPWFEGRAGASDMGLGFVVTGGLPSSPGKLRPC